MPTRRAAGDPDRRLEWLAGGAAALAALLLAGAFLVAAVTAPARGSEWAAAVALLLIVGAGLLYASRLGASGPR
jgi:hypothetical protein